MSPQTFDAQALLGRLWAMDAVLVRSGFPPMSPWWRDVVSRFVTARAQRRVLRRLLIRAGRRSGKSTTMCRLAVAWALYGPWFVPPGDLAVVAIVSINLTEATARLRTIEAILTALGIDHARTQEGVQIRGSRPVLFRCFACTTTSVIGFTAIAILCDEVCAWRDDQSGANPASEVLSYLTPTMATQPFAFAALISSPRSTDDMHFELFEKGDQPEQLTAEAPTWIANPTLTEEETHGLEPDVRVWSREYAGIPQASVLGAFDADAIDRAFSTRTCVMRPQQRVLVADPSSGKKDTWSFGIAGWSEGSDGRTYLVVDHVDGIEGSYWKQVSGDEVVERVATLAKNRGIHAVHSDQRESFMLAAAFTRHGLKFIEHPWTGVNKPQAVATVRRWLAEGTLVLPEHRKLRAELLKFEERSTPSGAFTFGARGNGHDDYVALLLTLALAETEGQLSGSPSGARWPDGELYIGVARGVRQEAFWGGGSADNSNQLASLYAPDDD